MSEILLNNQVIVYLVSESILFVLMLIALLPTIKIVIKWKFYSFSQEQFALEKRAYLVATIVDFIFVVKFFLLIYFVFTIDALSILVPGAMCAAGVVSANDYGMPLLFFKLLILFVMLLWMTLHRYDLEAKEYPFMRYKSWLFIAIFVLVVVEMLLEIGYFTHIDTRRVVSCCSALFGQLEGANPLPFGLDMLKMIIRFYLLYFVNIVALIARYRALTMTSSILFLIISYYSVVYFFGTYVYELPTHKCPFCMMQKEYYFIGYLVWGSLFGGVSISLVWAIMGSLFGIDKSIYRNISVLFISIFVLICTSYVVVYYFRNGVFL
ncbi:MAG: hypothetical protein HF962_04590 [Sulfurovum sp.]|nr:hypothetical protein [Sulfurovum sp.]